jgi:hypothetical protein
MTRKYDPARDAQLGNADDIGVSLVMTEDGRAIFEPMEPRAVRRATPQQLSCIADLQEPVRVIAAAVQDLDRAVIAARMSGLSWQTIGWCVGTSSEAARQRWGDRLEGEA